ncbi:hypothetical protein POSPLADRAFT_1149046 [Postia placenta MAD-698-R-SB12]|uniref:Uncharacterized protein n=1 Tax=Postia placenta MAD-698-R-SB12 TaxID=670580 RepID=A0A1X6MUL6_9APHY|nr:hypothetical protein POSPLADRAFT_1149046 [Postia placenta MAD-698-R-SB12]OSX60071.1 hypothetical protein POSPLADRAFT_1149046 [Postia placenta MAD-698-R-SB12]
MGSKASHLSASETQPLLGDARSNARSPSSSSSSNHSVTVADESPDASVTDLPDQALISHGLGALVSSLLVDSVPGMSAAGRWAEAHLEFTLTIAQGWCVALGGTTALDTLGSQAFTGGDRLAVSVHLQRCLVLLWLLFIPVAILWAFIEPVLLALGQEQRLSHDVQSFLRILIVGAPGYIGFESVKKYLQCQGILHLSRS